MSLAGRTVLVTRPQHQAAALSDRIRAAGGAPCEFPALAIEAVAPDALCATLDALPVADAATLTIFISPNAARFGLAGFGAAGRLPLAGAVFAVGPGTARVLRDAGVAQVIVPAGHDSEALLALPELQAVAGRHAIIVRGFGGRPLLADTLRERGATVNFVECYRRVRPQADAAPLVARWQAGGIDAVTATSAETLDNLADLLGARGGPLLARTPLFVPHAKIGEAARRLGLSQVVVTAGGDAGLVEGLINWFGNTHERHE